MQNTIEDVMSKVAKLLRLSQSSNPHEAALAAGRAQELIARHNLNIDGILLTGAEPQKSAEPVEEFRRDPLDSGRDTWKQRLAIAIAKQNGCKTFLRGGDGALCLVGRASGVQTVRYMYGYLVREVERIAALECKGCGRTYWNNFRLGCVETIAIRLRRSEEESTAEFTREATASSSHALVLVNRALAIREEEEADVTQYMVGMGLRKGSARRSTVDPTARAAGRAAGHRAQLTKASGSLASSRPSISAV